MFQHWGYAIQQQKICVKLVLTNNLVWKLKLDSWPADVDCSMHDRKQRIINTMLNHRKGRLKNETDIQIPKSITVLIEHIQLLFLSCTAPKTFEFIIIERLVSTSNAVQIGPIYFWPMFGTFEKHTAISTKCGFIKYTKRNIFQRAINIQIV